MPTAGNVNNVYCNEINCEICQPRRLAEALRVTAQEELSMPRNPDTSESLAYCWSCDQRMAARLLVQCLDCSDYVCETCRGSTHIHNGDHCDACGFRLMNRGTVDVCRECDDRYCADHESMHDRCIHGEDYAYGDDGRDYGRPPVVGYGREASINLIDDSYIPHPQAQGRRSVAIEIEAEYNNTEAPKASEALTLDGLVGIGDDGSLNNGIEVTTPPVKGAQLVSIITETMNAMSQHGYGVSSRCGLHTHIDLRDKKGDSKFLAHLFNAFFAIEDILFAMQVSRRHSNSYSIPLRQSFKFFDMYGQKSGDFDYTYYKQPKTVDGHYMMENEKTRKYAANRYMAFNFHSVYFRGSLECRLMEGTLDPERALAWIDLLQSVIARVEKGHSYSAMQRIAGMNVSIQKVNAMARYFGLTNAQREFIKDQINAGHGFSFRLFEGIQWGTPVKGRPKRHLPAAMQFTPAYIGQDVSCYRCSNVWLMRRSDRRCPSCLVPLMNRWGEREYGRAAPLLRNTPPSYGGGVFTGTNTAGQRVELNLENYSVTTSDTVVRGWDLPAFTSADEI